MTVSVYVNGVREHDSRFTWVLGTDSSLKRWSQLENLFSHYNCAQPRTGMQGDLTLVESVNVASNILTSALQKVNVDDYDDADDDGDKDLVGNGDSNCNMSAVRFCVEQLQLACSSPYSRRYSNNMLQFAFTLFVRSSACCRILLGTGAIILPQQRNLQRLSSVLSFSPGVQSVEHEQMRYLRLKAQSLTEREKYVILQVDEIHVMQSLQYRGGRITGVAENSTTEQANSIQAFLIASMAGSLREIVALVPVKQLTAATLKDMIMNVISIVQACGYVVVVLASDNNQINAKAFEDLCSGSEMCAGFRNPDFPDSTVFVLFDTVHILKCVRNNWLNQKDCNQTFTYPQPCPTVCEVSGEASVSTPSPAFPTVVSVVVNNVAVPLLLTPVCPVAQPPTIQHTTAKASIACLKAQYELEKSALLKEAPGLSYKTLYPSNLERQKVSLVLGVFNEKTVEALLAKADAAMKNTAAFIAVILNWWKIANIKSCLKGDRLRDDMCQPFRTVTDNRLVFLAKFVSWLELWSEQCGSDNAGCLSKPTLRALIHTTKTMRTVITYCLTKLHFEYVLPGKLQTDNLERRFGLYRQLCGANYHVSVAQVLEAEKKLRVSSLFALRSAKHGIVNIRHVYDEVDCEQSDTVVGAESAQVLDVVSEALDLNFACDEHTLVYIAGYVAFKCSNKVACVECKCALVTDRTLTVDEVNTDIEVDISYIQHVSRGGLKYPSYLLVLCGYRVYSVVQVLLSRKYEEKFLKVHDQRQLLCALSRECLVSVELSTAEVCSCSSSRLSLFSKCVRVFANIFLNNYTKINKVSGPSRKRKLKAISGSC